MADRVQRVVVDVGGASWFGIAAAMVVFLLFTGCEVSKFIDLERAKIAATPTVEKGTDDAKDRRE